MHPVLFFFLYDSHLDFIYRDDTSGVVHVQVSVFTCILVEEEADGLVILGTHDHIAVLLLDILITSIFGWCFLQLKSSLYFPPMQRFKRNATLKYWNTTSNTWPENTLPARHLFIWSNLSPHVVFVTSCYCFVLFLNVQWLHVCCKYLLMLLHN